MPETARDSLKFLGTAGARFAVSTQTRHSGGLVWTLRGFTLWVDPGPGALVRALAARPRVDPRRVDAVLVSHRHLDHCGDATVVVEAMTEGGRSRRGTLLAPRDALEVEPVVFRYAQAFPARLSVLEEGCEVALAPGLTLSAPLAHDHGTETYGYRLRAPGLSVAHVTDTFWMDALADAYARVDLLVVNATRLRGGDRHLLHLGWDDAERLVAAIRPRAAILTHLGMQVLQAGPEDRAREMTERLGVPVVAARDGMAVPLDDLAALRARAEEQRSRRSRGAAR
ncbi:MAG TPA: MBL fold metallo-hydrolase [Anaeromyxobacteraceae bacterium]|nr:MBL fold metallo-hydrolase [Anaeromyxobacteraceae bacterium]